jgi:hypothetical protein
VAQRGERYWSHSNPFDDDADADLRDCARGMWCDDPVFTRQGDGTIARQPRPGPRAFCDVDRGVISMRLGQLPEGHRRLAAEAGELRRGNSTLRMPFGPSLPLHEGMEALCSEITRTLAGWQARVAGITPLTYPDARMVLAGDGRAAARAADVLAGRIDALLGLQYGWMVRHVPVHARRDMTAARDPITRPRTRALAPDWLPSGEVCRPRGASPVPEDVADLYADCEIVRVTGGSLAVLAWLSGTDAGLEILDLHRRCQKLLGEVRTRPETLDGVPCRQQDCGDMALERAEPPSDPSRPAMYSECATCHHMMTLEEYREWSAWYARWADGAGLECARCQRGYHAECEYGGCRCMACGHLAA